MRDGDKKVLGCLVHEVVDKDGNRQMEERDYSWRVPVEPEFVKMYGMDVTSLNAIKGLKREVLTLMAAMMNYDNVVALTPSERKRWAVELEVSYYSINNSIAGLCKAGAIRKSGSGEYVVCPTMFAKGEWKKVMQKRQDFDAHFIVRYEHTKAGYTRTFREAKVKPIGMKVDLETGKPLYKYKKGGEFEEKRQEGVPEIVDDEDCPY